MIPIAVRRRPLAGPGRASDRRLTIITAALRTSVRLLLTALALALPSSLLFGGVASADFFTPENGGSPNGDAIDNLYKLLFALGVVVFIAVEGALIYSLFKFKARKGTVPAQIRGNTRLEIGWTVGAALILVVIAVVTFVQLDDIRNAPESDPEGLRLASATEIVNNDGPVEQAVPPSGKSLKILVNGQQYIWRYTYPDEDDNILNNAFSYEEMVIPVDTTVTLEITSQDVQHSWWIPELGGKFDALPGHTNYTWFKVPGKWAGETFETGKIFRGQCAELCGRNHANMVAHVRAVTPEQYEAFIERRRDEIAAANEEAARQREEQEQAAEETGTEEATQPGEAGEG
jgi:cytochrome c oxidase subunit 2